MLGVWWAWVRSMRTSASGRPYRSTISSTAKSLPAMPKARSATMSPRCCAALKPLKLERLHRPPEPDCLRQRGRREASIWQLADVFVAMKDHEGSLHAAIRALAICEIPVLQREVQNFVLRHGARFIQAVHDEV